MKFLLFFITMIYSAIFFIFYKLDNGINIFSGLETEHKYFYSLFGNLFIESVLFFVLAFFLLIYFLNNNFFYKIFEKIKINKKNKKEEISEELHLLENNNIDNLERKNIKKNIISEEKKYLFRAISFILLYIFIIFGIFYLCNNFYDLINIVQNFSENIFSLKIINFIFSILIIIFLIFSVFVNFNIHKKYENYISLFFSILAFVFIFNFIIKFILNTFFIDFSVLEIFKIQLILNITISFFIVIFTYLYTQKYLFDYIFLHFCALFVNILGIIYYFYNGGFSFKILFIIIFLDIILLGLSYFKLSKVKINLL